MPSMPPEASRVPSGLNDKPRASVVLADNSDTLSVAKSQMRTLPSTQAPATVLPSGLKASLRIPDPLQSDRHGLPVDRSKNRNSQPVPGSFQLAAIRWESRLRP